MKNSELNIQKIIMMAKRKKIEIKENGEINKLVGCKNNKKRSLKVTQRNGYDKVLLTMEKKFITSFAHRVIWTYFRGRIPEGYTINHKDGNKRNNALDNLELATQKEQTYHAMYVIKTRNNMRGENNYNSKITMQDARNIRRLRYNKKMTYREIGKFYNMRISGVCSICLNKTWKEDDELV